MQVVKTGMQLMLLLALAAESALGVQPPVYRDIEPILAKHCHRCHRPGEVAPMSLLSFEEVRPWARSIQRAVRSGAMPPWFADPSIGEFKNDARLSAEEIDTVVGWVDAGAQRGDRSRDPDTSPAARHPAPEWRIGTPDMVVSMPEPYSVPATGVVDYVYLRMPTRLSQDRWIQALEVQPGDRSVVHHIDVMVCRPGCTQDATLAALVPGVPTLMPESPISTQPEPSAKAWVEGTDIEFLASFLPGGRPLELPEGYARLLPKGAELVLNIHYAPNGEKAEDQSRVGFVFGKRPQHRVISYFLDNYSLWIPAGAPEYQLSSSARLARPAKLLGITPHMHFRGRAAEVSLSTPDGGREAVLLVPRYDFNWQITYLLNQPRKLTAGTEIDYLLRWDNSATNPDNPDPSREVPWGRQTRDEMASVFLTLAVPTDVQPAEVFESRE